MRNFNEEYSLVRMLHAVSSQDEVDVYINGSPFFKNLEFTQFSPYVYVPKGTYTVEVYPEHTKDNPIIVETIEVDAQELLTIAIIVEDKVPKLLEIEEDMEIAEGSKSKVRFVHLVPNGRTVNILMDGETIFSDVSYTDITEYEEIDPKVYKVDVEVSQNNKLITTMKETINPNRIYTFYAIGDAPNFEVYQSLDGATFLA